MDAPKKLIIYYFSGTGNAKAASQWIIDFANNQSIHCELLDISKLPSRRQIPSPQDNVMVGFASPTHGFNFPPIMFHFILRFPRGNKNKVFILNTRAGLKMHKLFVPGLSGMAQYFTAIILCLKNYKVVGMFPVDLPSNWISLHPGVKQQVTESIYAHRKNQVYTFAAKILSGEKNYRALLGLVPDLLITPIAPLYYLIGRFVLAKTYFASSKCTRCELCIKQCPVQAIKLVDSRPFWTLNCESCMRCMNKCPERAIETPHGFVFALIAIFNGLLLIPVYNYLHINDLLQWMPGRILSLLTDALMYSAIFLLMLLVSYRIMHYLLKFKVIERLMVYTSLTSYTFWRRYKRIK